MKGEGLGVQMCWSRNCSLFCSRSSCCRGRAQSSNPTIF